MPNMFISNSELRNVLKQATIDEKLSLTKIFSEYEKEPYHTYELQKKICRMGGHGVINIYRGQGTGYLDIVDEVADELGIKSLPDYYSSVKYYEEIESLTYSEDESREKGIKYTEEAEEKIILAVLKLIYEKCPDEKKEKFDEQVNIVARQFNSNLSKNLTGAAGLVALGNLGGFATYTFLTTAMSTISIGTLGFGAYTAATSLLSIALGPIGWAGLGIAGVLSLSKPEYEKLISIVFIIGTIRQRIKSEFTKPTEPTKKEKKPSELVTRLQLHFHMDR